jgi:hypothetical protein
MAFLHMANNGELAALTVPSRERIPVRRVYSDPPEPPSGFMSTPATVQTSRLFELPPELRLQIYEHALAPYGVLCLSQYSPFTTPTVTPALLATCKQIYNEADDIIYTCNEVCIELQIQRDNWYSILKKRIPQKIFKRLQHLCVILNCTDTLFRRIENYIDLDLAPFKALASLKTLRIAMIFDKILPGQRLPLHFAAANRN